MSWHASQGHMEWLLSSARKRDRFLFLSLFAIFILSLDVVAIFSWCFIFIFFQFFMCYIASWLSPYLKKKRFINVFFIWILLHVYIYRYIHIYTYLINVFLSTLHTYIYLFCLRGRKDLVCFTRWLVSCVFFFLDVSLPFLWVHFVSFLLDRIDSEASPALRRAATLLAAEDGQAAEPQGGHDHTHHVVRQEEHEAWILV